MPTGTQPTADLGESTQEVNSVINGFDNKYCSRVLVVKTFTDKTHNYVGNNGRGNGNIVSEAMFKEEFNVRHSGATIFNGDNLSNQGFKQMLLEETWGQCVVPPFGALTEVGSDIKGDDNLNCNGVPSRGGGSGAHTKSNVVGQYDYIGFQLESYVKQLQINYKRVIVKDTDAALDSSIALDVHLYAEVRKQLSFNGNGEYDISYV